MSISDIDGYGWPSSREIFLSSTRVKVDSYCLLSMFDLSSGSACHLLFCLLLFFFFLFFFLNKLSIGKKFMCKMKD